MNAPHTKITRRDAEFADNEHTEKPVILSEAKDLLSSAYSELCS